MVNKIISSTDEESNPTINLFNMTQVTGQKDQLKEQSVRFTGVDALGADDSIFHTD